MRWDKADRYSFLRWLRPRQYIGGAAHRVWASRQSCYGPSASLPLLGHRACPSPARDESGLRDNSGGILSAIFSDVAGSERSHGRATPDAHSQPNAWPCRSDRLHAILFDGPDDVSRKLRVAVKDQKPVRLVVSPSFAQLQYDPQGVW